MNTLWPMGEGNGSRYPRSLGGRRPRAYTTIMTIMDRLARKGVVERPRAGRAYIYRPNLSAEEARAHALSQIVESFFGGSREALLTELGAITSIPRARAAAAGANSANVGAQSGLSAVPVKTALAGHAQTAANEEADGAESEAAERIDDTLL